jgi:hypothetical protein
MADNPAASPVAVPANDQNAKYFETIGKLAYQENKASSEYGRQLGTDRANSQYRQGLLSQQEPGSYRTNQARANAGGILESGINARNRGGIATNYANKRFSLGQGLKEQEGGLARNLAKEQEANQEGQHRAGLTALEEGKANLLATNPQTPVAPKPKAPGQIQALQGTPWAPPAPSAIPRIKSETAQPTTGGVRRAAGQNYIAKARARANRGF